MITVSCSEIAAYKACKKKWYFQYRENLKPLVVAEALETGKTYHDKVAQIIKTGDFQKTGEKTDAMAMAWRGHIYPRLTFNPEPEQFFEKILSIDVRLIGYVDAMTTDGAIVEHKTTSVPIDEAYIHRLGWDDQIPTYMIGTGAQEVWYTACQKPTIRQKKTETEEEYIDRCVQWYDDDPESSRKIDLFRVYRHPEELEEKKNEIIQIAREMDECKFCYRNPRACSIYGCDFSSICLNYDPKFLVGFEKREGRNERK